MSRLNAPPAVVESASIEPRATGLELAASLLASRLSDYLQLTKPRIVVLELIVAAAAARLAVRHAIDLRAVLHALGATALVAASASIANQYLERRVDARMRRTAGRPLPAGRVAGGEAVALSAATLLLGVGWLAAQVNRTTALLGVASWVLYVVVYTPLKSRTPAQHGCRRRRRRHPHPHGLDRHRRPR